MPLQLPSINILLYSTTAKSTHARLSVFLRFYKVFPLFQQKCICTILGWCKVITNGCFCQKLGLLFYELKNSFKFSIKEVIGFIVHWKFDAYLLPRYLMHYVSCATLLYCDQINSQCEYRISKGGRRTKKINGYKLIQNKEARVSLIETTNIISLIKGLSTYYIGPIGRQTGCLLTQGIL